MNIESNKIKIINLKYKMDKNIDNKIKKYLKSYLTAKKYYDTDIDKSYEYFKQCVKILDDIKKLPIQENFVEILDETETECGKYITNTIQQIIEKPTENNKEINKKEENELFQIIETGNIDKLKEYKYGEFKISYDKNGQTPLHYAIKFGDTTFLKYAFKIGAKIDQTDKCGHTLLECACLEKDPNMINFLLSCGADMKKHLKFREGNKYYNNGNQIDIILLEKIIINEPADNKYKIKYLEWIFNYIKDDYISLEICALNNSTVSERKIPFTVLIQKLDFILNNLSEESRNTYLSIIKDELSYDLSFKLGCPTNKKEILLYNLVPFIDYEFNLKLDWLLSLEIKFIIIKILKNKVKININDLKNELFEFLYNSYIKENIISENNIDILVLQWINKIKV